MAACIIDSCQKYCITCKYYYDNLTIDKFLTSMTLKNLMKFNDFRILECRVVKYILTVRCVKSKIILFIFASTRSSKTVRKLDHLRYEGFQGSLRFREGETVKKERFHN